MNPAPPVTNKFMVENLTKAWVVSTVESRCAFRS